MNALIKPSWSVGKSVNNGPAIHIGTYYSELEALNAGQAAESFHLERCPKDIVKISIHAN